MWVILVSLDKSKRKPDEEEESRRWEQLANGGPGTGKGNKSRLKMGVKNRGEQERARLDPSSSPPNDKVITQLSHDSPIPAILQTGLALLGVLTKTKDVIKCSDVNETGKPKVWTQKCSVCVERCCFWLCWICFCAPTLLFQQLASESHSTLIRLWHAGSLTLWCVRSCACGFWVLQFERNLLQFSVLFFLIQYLGISVSFWLFFGYLCYRHTCLWIFTQAVRMPSNSVVGFFCLFALLFFCLFHFFFVSLFHKIVPLPSAWLSWMRSGWEVVVGGGCIWMIWYAATAPFCFIAGAFALSP